MYNYHGSTRIVEVIFRIIYILCQIMIKNSIIYGEFRAENNKAPNLTVCYLSVN